jgi:hypothetical protein
MVARGKKTAIVALARKLLVALWKYVTFGEGRPCSKIWRFFSCSNSNESGVA